MKYFPLSRLSIALSPIATLFFAVIVLSSCGTSRHPFAISSVVPAAEGSVKVKKDGNNNYKIDLDVKRLAEANRLEPSKEGYVVWMETAQNGRKNIGQLKTSSSFLSGSLKSSLSTVSAFKPTRFFITAEDDVNTQYPGTVVLTTDAF